MASKEAAQRALKALRATYRFNEEDGGEVLWKMAFDSMTDSQVAMALDHMAKRYDSNFAPAPGLFRRCGVEQRYIPGSKLDRSKLVWWRDEKQRDFVYHPDLKSSAPPTPDDLARQPKLEPMGKEAAKVYVRGLAANVNRQEIKGRKI